MGLLGKFKKKDQPVQNSEEIESEPEPELDEDTLEDTEEITSELDDSPVDEEQEDLLGLISEETDEPQNKNKDDDDILSGDLLDIFADDENTGPDLDALSEYLEDVDIESLLAQAQNVSNRLRGVL